MDSKPFNRKKILVIDDDSDARELLCSLLELNGYPVACAENGQLALDNIEADEIPAALILPRSRYARDGWAILPCARPRRSDSCRSADSRSHRRD